MHSEIIINNHYKDINPLIFGYQSCESSHSYGPAVRSFWLLHFVVSGKGVFQIGDNQYDLSDGTMFVIPPLIQTYYEADAEEPWSYIWIGFTGNPPLELHNTYHIPKALRIFEQMKACHDLQESKTEFLLSKLWELFSLLLEKCRTPADPIEAALNLIHAEYMMPLTVRQMADWVYLERTYFSGLFLKRTGVSPKQYLINHRMQQAKFLLTNGIGVAVTANSVGYSDVFTFSKMFKKYFGESPSQFRQRNIKSVTV